MSKIFHSQKGIGGSMRGDIFFKMRGYLKSDRVIVFIDLPASTMASDIETFTGETTQLTGPACQEDYDLLLVVLVGRRSESNSHHWAEKTSLFY